MSDQYTWIGFGHPGTQVGVDVVEGCIGHIVEPLDMKVSGLPGEVSYNMFVSVDLCIIYDIRRETANK